MMPDSQKKILLLKQRHRKLSDLSEEGKMEPGSHPASLAESLLIAHSAASYRDHLSLWQSSAFEFPLGRNELDVMFQVSPFQHLMGI